MTARTEIPLATEVLKAAGTIVADRFVGGPKSATVQTGAAGNATGVAKSIAATGEYFSAVTQGVTIVEAGAAIADNALVESDAAGRAITKAAGVTLGRAIGAATGLGDKLQVRLIVN